MLSNKLTGEVGDCFLDVGTGRVYAAGRHLDNIEWMSGVYSPLADQILQNQT